MMFDNLVIVFKKEVEKLNNFINEMNEELNSQTLKLNLTVEKAENSFQQYELLYYEIGTLKKNLLEKAKENTKENLDKISKIKKPNEAIYLLMNMFIKIISKETDNNLSWDFIQKNLSYENYSSYLLSLSKSVNVEMSKKDLDEAMPFLVNYEKLKLPIKELGEEYLPILNFIKSSVEYNVKLNIIKDLFNSNLNKNKKINSIQVEVNKVNDLLQKCLSLLEEMNNELNELLKLKEKDLNEYKKYKLHILQKYNLSEKYNVILEISRNQNKEKYIIRLKTKFKKREEFIEQLLKSSSLYLSKKKEELNKSLILYLLNNEEKIDNIIRIDSKKLKYPIKKFKPLNYLGISKIKTRSFIGNNNITKSESSNKTCSLIFQNNNILSPKSEKKKQKKTNKESETDIHNYTNKESNIDNSDKNSNDVEYNNTGNLTLDNQTRTRKSPLLMEDDKEGIYSYYCCKFFN